MRQQSFSGFHLLAICGGRGKGEGDFPCLLGNKNLSVENRWDFSQFDLLNYLSFREKS